MAGAEGHSSEGDVAVIWTVLDVNNKFSKYRIIIITRNTQTDAGPIRVTGWLQSLMGSEGRAWLSEEKLSMKPLQHF